MDYFSELLESYSKLKKRTFKLTYLSEADNDKKKEKPDDGSSNQESMDAASMKDAEAKALEVVKAGITQKYDNKYAASGVPPYTFLSSSKNKINLMGGPVGSRQQVIADAGGNPDVNSDAWKKLVNYFLNGEGARDSAERDQAAIEKEERRQIGGFFKQQEIEVTDETLASLTRSQQIVNRFLTPSSKGTQTRELKRIKGKLWAYFAAGDLKQGLEYKLATSQPLVVVDIEAGITKKGQASIGAIEQFSKSAEFLFSFLEETNPEKCQKVKNRIGLYKEKSLVLFGKEKDEAIVVGEPNGIQKLAIDRIKNGCDGLTLADLSQLVDDGINPKAKNAVKGTFFESLVSFSGKVFGASTSGEKKEAMQELQSIIRKKKAILTSIMEDLDLEAGQSIDEAFTTEVQQETLELLKGTPENLVKGIMKELKATQPFIKFMGAKTVSHEGRASKTGQRADLMFIYDDADIAATKADAVGSSVTKLDDGSYGIGVGLKRLKEIHGAKFGEINSLTRMHSLILGTVEDSHVESGFEASMTKRQFGKEGTQRQKDMVAFADNLYNTVGKTIDQLVVNKSYINNKGEIKTTTPENTFSDLGKLIIGSTSFRQANDSLISKAFFDEDTKGNLVPKKFGGDSPGAEDNRERGKEIIGRVARFTKLKQAVEEGNVAAMDYIIKSALVCGSNKDNMTQLIVDDSGEMLTVKHNEVFDIITKAMNSSDQNKRPSFSFKESGVTVEVDGIGFTYSQEHNTAGEFGHNTRSQVKITKNTLFNSKLSGDITLSEETVFQFYIKEHINLLKSLVV